MTEVIQLKSFGTSLPQVDLGGGERFDWVRLKEDLGDEIGQAYSHYSNEAVSNGFTYWMGTIVVVAFAVIGLIFTVIALN